MTALEYYYVDGRHVVFNRYTIDTNGVIQNNNSKKNLSYVLIHGYYMVSVRDNDDTPRFISVARAVASTFLGKPQTLQHTADHINSKQKLYNNINNIRWANKSEQSNNQKRSDTKKSAFIIVKDKTEMTAKEWEKHLKDTLNPFGRLYTSGMINKYAVRKQHGFSFKDYPNLEGEKWRHVKDSETPRGEHWEISNKSRVKFVMKYASNVLSGERLGLQNGYPSIYINGKKHYCHIISFEAFNSTVLRDGLMVLHKHDDKLDFSPQNLRLGSASENCKDAYNNGKYDGTKSARMKCASYIDDSLEEIFDSKTAAVNYLQANGYRKASLSNISMALSGKYKLAYGRVWKYI